MAEYRSVVVEVPGEDEDFSIEVPVEWVPRVGEVMDLTYDDRFPQYARTRIPISEVRWYQASGERYRPILVLDV